MNSAQFKTMRESMGMSSTWLAHQCGVHPRTVQRWEATMTPPQEAVDFLEGWWSLFADRIQEVLTDINAYGDRGAITLTRFLSDSQVKEAGEAMTTSMHTALLGHVAMACSQIGIPVEIVWKSFE